MNKKNDLCKMLLQYDIVNKNNLKNLCVGLQKFWEEKTIKKLRGFNDFNYINLLRGFWDELAHSRIIAEFLDPHGSHYQGDIFLKNFFDSISFTSTTELNKWRVFTEYDVGFGRIDILLTNFDQFIIIENKINAGDQESQIYRYVKNLKLKDYTINVNKKYVFYLTLFGRSPSKNSLGNSEINEDEGILEENTNKLANFRLLSYKIILEWMQKNKMEVENISNLRESIKQYITAIKNILNQKEGTMSLSDYLLESENKELVIYILEKEEKIIDEINELEGVDKNKCIKILEEENISKVIKNIITKLKKEIIEFIVEKLTEFSTNKKYNLIGESYFSNFVIYKPLSLYKNNWCKNGKPLISFSIEFNHSGNLIYGIRLHHEWFQENEDIKGIIRSLSNLSIDYDGFKKSDYWLIYRNFNAKFQKDLFVESMKNGIFETANKKFIEPFVKLVNSKENELMQQVEKIINN